MQWLFKTFKKNVKCRFLTISDSGACKCPVNQQEHAYIFMNVSVYFFFNLLEYDKMHVFQLNYDFYGKNACVL